MKTLINITLAVLIVLFVSSCSRQKQEEQKPVSDTTAKVTPPAAADTTKPSVEKLPTLSRSEKPETAAADTVVGGVYVAGNEPFIRLMLSLGPSKSINLEGDSAIIKTLWKMQGERIRVVGTIRKSVMGNAIIIKEYQVVK